MIVYLARDIPPFVMCCVNGASRSSRLFLHVTCTSNDIIVQLWLCFNDSVEQSSCDELMEFKQIQTRAQPEESLKHNHSCTMMSLLVQVT